MSLYRGNVLISGAASSSSSSVEVFNKTLLASGWTLGSDGRYYQSIAVDGVTDTTKLIIVDVDLTTNNLDNKKQYLSAWEGPSANECAQSNGYLTFYSYDLPEINIPIFVGVAT